MFDNFPYTDMHQLNLDWIIKIAKDFLDQYTTIQQIITDGQEQLGTQIETGLSDLQTKAENLESLLQEWYNTHSSDIADQLTAALGDLSSALTTAISDFNTAANTKAADTIATIPDDYTTLSNNVRQVADMYTLHESANSYAYAFVMLSDLMEVGKWSEGTGNANTANNQIRSITFLDNTQRYHFHTLSSTVRFMVLKYNIDNSYVGYVQYSGINDIIIEPSTVYKYKINVYYVPSVVVGDIPTYFYGAVEPAYGYMLNDLTELNNIMYGDSIPWEVGKWSEGTGNANQNTSFIRTETFIKQGVNIDVTVKPNTAFYVLEYNNDGTYTTNWKQYNEGHHDIVLNPEKKYKLNAAAIPTETITNIPDFLSNHLEITYEDSLIYRVDANTEPKAFWTIPDTVYVLTNTPSRIYFNEIFMTNQRGYFDITVTNATYPEVIYTSEYIEFNTTSTKNITIRISFNNFYKTEISYKQITVRSLNSVAVIPAKKYMFIGDSLTNEGTLPLTFKTLMGDRATLYGTRTSKDVNHEGRPGWGISHYYNSPSYGGIDNPFYNPSTQKFDFSYYMSNNPSFQDVDHVNIFLGRNNGYDLVRIPQLMYIIDSIKDYDSNITITVMWAYNLASDNSGAGAYLQNVYRMTYNGKLFNYNLLLETMPAGVYITPENMNFDNYYDYAREEVNATPLDTTDKRIVFTDNVHPAESGYKSWAYVLWAFVRHILLD